MCRTQRETVGSLSTLSNSGSLDVSVRLSLSPCSDTALRSCATPRSFIHARRTYSSHRQSSYTLASRGIHTDACPHNAAVPAVVRARVSPRHHAAPLRLSKSLPLYASNARPRAPSHTAATVLWPRVAAQPSLPPTHHLYHPCRSATSRTPCTGCAACSTSAHERPACLRTQPAVWRALAPAAGWRPRRAELRGEPFGAVAPPRHVSPRHMSDMSSCRTCGLSRPGTAS